LIYHKTKKEKGEMGNKTVNVNIFCIIMAYSVATSDNNVNVWCSRDGAVL
jgi:hypothetical protein